MSQTSGASRLYPVRAAIVLATGFTAGVHVYLALAPNSPQPQLRLLFFLAALGYLGAATALYAPLPFLEPLRGVARLALISVTVSTIVAYFVVMGFTFDALSLSDKLVEGVLLVALILDAAGARQEKDAARASDDERNAGRAAA